MKVPQGGKKIQSGLSISEKRLCPNENRLKECRNASQGGGGSREEKSICCPAKTERGLSPTYLI